MAQQNHHTLEVFSLYTMIECVLARSRKHRHGIMQQLNMVVRCQENKGGHEGSVHALNAFSAAGKLVRHAYDVDKGRCEYLSSCLT
jgi:hypothetical protein